MQAEQSELERLRMENALLKKFHTELRRHAAREAQYRVIYHYREEYAVKAMCDFFGVSRAAYYAWVKRTGQPDPDQERMKQVQEAYEASKRTYGYRRISSGSAAETGRSCINHKAVLRLMNKLDIRSVARKRKLYQKTGDSWHLPPLSQPAQPRFYSHPTQPEVGHGYHLHSLPNRAGPICPPSKICTMASSSPMP